MLSSCTEHRYLHAVPMVSFIHSMWEGYQYVRKTLGIRAELWWLLWKPKGVTSLPSEQQLPDLFMNFILWSVRHVEPLPVTFLSPGWEEAELPLHNLPAVKLQGTENQQLRVKLPQAPWVCPEKHNSKGPSGSRSLEVLFDHSVPEVKQDTGEPGYLPWCSYWPIAVLSYAVTWKYGEK